MAVLRTPLQRAHALAARQSGVITFEQACRSGLTPDQTWTLAERGDWRRVVRGVFVVAGSPDSPAQRAVVASLAVGSTGGVLSHLSAAAAFGLLPAPQRPHVTVPVGSSARCPVATVHRSDVAPWERARATAWW